MRTSKLKWAALLTVPLLLALAMWPAAQRQRREGNVREATRALVAEMKGQQRGVIRPDVVRQLVAMGAEVNVRDSEGYTILHYMATTPITPERECGNLLRFLIAHGANVNAQQNDGMTPLMLAARAQGQVEEVQVLLKHGATVNLRQNSRKDANNALTLAWYELGYIRGYAQARVKAALTSSGRAWTPGEARASAQAARNQVRVIYLLKAAGAHE